MNFDPSPLRRVSRDAVRQEIAETALELFEQGGFDQTTVDAIASAVGMSQRTFFRYFATKEEVVLLEFERASREIFATLDECSAEQDLWETLTYICLVSVRQLRKVGAESQRMRRLQSIIDQSPQLIASNFRQFDELQEGLTDRLAARHAEYSNGEPIDRVFVRAMVGSAFGVLHAVIGAPNGPVTEDAERQFSDLMRALRPHTSI